MESYGVPAPRMDWDSTDLPEAWRRFKQHAQMMFHGPLRENAEADKCRALLLWIGEKGRDVCNTWTLTADEARTLQTYYDKYAAYITYKANPLYARYRFHERKQGEHESIEKFVTDLKLLVKDCGYQNGDEMVRDHVVFATNSPHLREKLLSQGAELTLEKAVYIIRSYELATQQLMSMGNARDDTGHAISRKPDRQKKTQKAAKRKEYDAHSASKSKPPTQSGFHRKTLQAVGESADGCEEDMDQEESDSITTENKGQRVDSGTNTVSVKQEPEDEVNVKVEFEVKEEHLDFDISGVEVKQEAEAEVEVEVEDHVATKSQNQAVKKYPSMGELLVKIVAATKPHSKERRRGWFSGNLKKALAAGGYDAKKNNGRINLVLKTLVKKGTLLRTSGAGACGSFAINKKRLNYRQFGLTDCETFPLITNPMGLVTFLQKLDANVAVDTWPSR